MRSDRTIIRKYAPLAVLAALALIYISPVLADIRNIGVADWDSQLFYHAAPLKTMLEYGQFPLWNPYFCGGAPMLASPELSFLSPAYVFVLLFGEVVGVKLVIVLFTVLGMWGMYMLSRTLGLGRLSALFPPVAYIMSSWYALRITEGHSGFLPFALLPYVVAFYVKSVENRSIKSFILSGLFWAWMILAGGVYPTTVTAIFLFFFSILHAVSKRSISPLLNLFIIAVITFSFSAVKSLPQYEFISSFPRKTSAVQYNSGALLKDSLFKRDQRVTAQAAEFYKGAGEDEKEYLRAFWRGERPWGWQEYGAFVGIAAFALYCAGFAFIRRIWVWLSLSVISLLLSMGDFAPVNIWAYLRKLPVFGSLHGPSRIMPIFIFSLSVVGGYALSRLEGKADKWRLARPAVVAIIVLVFIEMITVSRPVLKDAFTEPPFNLTPNAEFTQIVVADPTKTNYPNFLKNIGVANCYESMHPPTAVSPYGDEAGRLNPYYTGEAYLASRGGAVVIRKFSPNEVIVEAESLSDDILVLNQNFFKGWKAEGAAREAESHNGLVSARVPAGKNVVRFYYSPTSFKIGLAVSAISLLAALAILLRRRRA
ncbi:MAG: hypothetical protein HY955_08205 [Deltaproteobacteria bacterium]|nr:hypothetical protein [Deltaproteobacteria bacterium]